MPNGGCRRAVHVSISVLYVQPNTNLGAPTDCAELPTRNDSSNPATKRQALVTSGDNCSCIVICLNQVVASKSRRHSRRSSLKRSRISRSNVSMQGVEAES